MSENQNLKKRTFSSMLWKFAERICAQFVSLAVSIILARLLIPEDYSVVSIVSIFFTFCNVFITGGLNTALIQKKNADQLDFSTVLSVSMIVAGLMYTLIYAFAPAIASLYNKEILIPVLRVMGLTFFINAYKSVICAYISSDLQFRTFFYATISGIVFSAFLGIAMALKGFGPWALVAQQMSNILIGTLVLSAITRVKLSFRISLSRLKGLFRYGWKVFATSIITVIYDQIRPLIIGVKFSSEDLAYYSKGNSFPSLLNNSISDTLSAVLFPVMSKYQDDIPAILAMTRRYMRISSYIVMPMMLGFFAISDNFICTLLTEKWLPAAPYIRIFCLAYLLNMIQTGNLQVIRAIGRSDILLKLEIIKKTSYFIILALFIWQTNDPKMLAVSTIVCSILASIINIFPNRKLIGYSYRLQLQDIIWNLFSAVVMAVIVSLMNRLPLPSLPLMLLQIICGGLIYILTSLITKNDNFNYILTLIVKRKGGNKTC